MKRQFFKFPLYFFAVITCCLLSSMAMARVVINVAGGNAAPIRIVIPDFVAAGTLGADMRGVILSDLTHTGLFVALSTDGFANDSLMIDKVPDFSQWKSLDTQALVVGDMSLTVSGKLSIRVRLWDIYAGQQIYGRQFFVSQNNWRTVAHMIADAIYQKMTGEQGYFDSRIVFVAEEGPRDKRVKRLAIMDQDGANFHYLTDGRDLVLTPRFSSDHQSIVFLSYASGIPQVYMRDLVTGKQNLVGNFPGMTIAPRFSPDGQQIIMSLLNQDGSASIYTMNLKTLMTLRLTDSSAIDTSASYSPDGRKIVFSSDRSGRPQLYVMNADGSNVRLLLGGSSSYTTPVWSPRGDYIAFTQQAGGRFSIGVVRVNGSDMRILTSGFYNEGPTWAPNGRVLMFFKQEQGEQPQLYSIDLSGSHEHLVATPAGASDPAWSGLLH